MLVRFNDMDGFPRFGLTRGFSFDALRREMDRMLFDFERDAPAQSESSPRMSVEDRGEALFFRAELPGLTDRDVDLTVTGTSFSLRAERKVEAPAAHSTHRTERRGFRFARTFDLNTKIDPERVEALLENGVLTVTLPKAAEAKPKQITVKAS